MSQSQQDASFVLNIMDISYFSGKLESYFRFAGIKHDRHEPSWMELVHKVYPNTSTMQVPTVYDKVTKQWFRDTTSIIWSFENIKKQHRIKTQQTKKASLNKTTDETKEKNQDHDQGAHEHQSQEFEYKFEINPSLDDRFLNKSICILPESNIQLWFSLLLEDMFDEWLWRPALYYRWYYDCDAYSNAKRFIKEFLLVKNDKYSNILTKYLPHVIARKLIINRQKTIYLINDGISPNDKDTNKYVQMQYIEILTILNNIFCKQDYLYGNIPCIADFGLMASMFRHFSLDPTPRKIMLLKAPYVYQWVARMWSVNSNDLIEKYGDNINLNYNYNYNNDHDDRDDNDDNDEKHQIPQNWMPLIALCKDYLRYLYKNEECFNNNNNNNNNNGNNNFDLDVCCFDYENNKEIDARLKGLPCVKFRVYCRHKLQQRFHNILKTEKEKEIAKDILTKCGCWEPLWKCSNDYKNNVYQVEPPFCQPTKLTFGKQIALMLNGTPKWDDGFLTQLTMMAAVCLIVFIAVVCQLLIVFLNSEGNDLPENEFSVK